MQADKITALLQPAVEALGYEIWGIEVLSQGKHSLLRLYIDKPTGITLEDCEIVSRQVSAILDVEEPIHSNYSLEVSSPGLDRRFFHLAQYAKYVGSALKVQTKMAIQGHRKFKGTLLSVTDTDIVIQVDNEEITLPFLQIDKGQLLA